MMINHISCIARISLNHPLLKQLLMTGKAIGSKIVNQAIEKNPKTLIFTTLNYNLLILQFSHSFNLVLVNIQNTHTSFAIARSFFSVKGPSQPAHLVHFCICLLIQLPSLNSSRQKNDSTKSSSTILLILNLSAHFFRLFEGFCFPLCQI